VLAKSMSNINNSELLCYMLHRKEA